MAVKNYGIHDKWTNINKVNNVEIQSVDGVIENIKVNGEPAGGGGGGGSSDLSIAILTISSQNAHIAFTLTNCIRIEGTNGERYFMSDDVPILSVDGEKKLRIPLIDNYWECSYTAEGGTPVLDVVGNGEASNGSISVTGDCTITIS